MTGTEAMIILALGLVIGGAVGLGAPALRRAWKADKELDQKHEEDRMMTEDDHEETP